MMYETFSERKQLVEDLQKYLISQFGDTNYNVFIYGSFFTDKFIPGKSDIDIAFYSKEVGLAMEIESAIGDFFKDKNIEVDTLFINTNYVDMYVYVYPLVHGIELTEYYPQELRDFRNIVAIRQVKRSMDPMLFD